MLVNVWNFMMKDNTLQHSVLHKPLMAIKAGWEFFDDDVFFLLNFLSKYITQHQGNGE